MKITKLNENSPSYNGYVHKSIYKYVNKSTNNAVKGLFKASEEAGIDVDHNHLNNILKMKNEIILALETLMSKTHPDTYIKLNRRFGSVTKISLTNKRAKHFGELNEYSMFFDAFRKKNFDFMPPFRTTKKHFNKPNEDDLIFFNRFAQSVKKFVNPNKTDDNLCFNAENNILEIKSRRNIFGKIKLLLFGKKFSKYAEEISSKAKSVKS